MEVRTWTCGRGYYGIVALRCTDDPGPVDLVHTDFLWEAAMNREVTALAIALALFSDSCVAAMALTSKDILSGAPIPIAHIYPRCGGRNISPQLSWSGAPPSAKSFVLTMIDVDVKPSQWSHWIVVDLPPNVSVLPQGADPLPGGAKALLSNFGDASYAGPCPPKGTGVHHYQFTIWALPTATLSFAPEEKAVDLITQLSRQALDHASLIGLVQAPTG
jgi:Raf kinase inhibitor-like YbhB/YbcL family protein